jgi:hypothetical protein
MWACEATSGLDQGPARRRGDARIVGEKAIEAPVPTIDGSSWSETKRVMATGWQFRRR